MRVSLAIIEVLWVQTSLTASGKFQDSLALHFSRLPPRQTARISLGSQSDNTFDRESRRSIPLRLLKNSLSLRCANETIQKIRIT